MLQFKVLEYQGWWLKTGQNFALLKKNSVESPATRSLSDYALNFDSLSVKFHTSFQHNWKFYWNYIVEKKHKVTDWFQKKVSCISQNETN